MEKLNFYDVDRGYIAYLQEEERKVRGFTRVPNMEYDGEQKFLCGIVLKINTIDYYVPVTSFKEKKSENIRIVFLNDYKNPVKGSLRFNYMIPVPRDTIKVRVIKEEPQINRRLFLNKQLEFCNNNITKILNQANRTYKRIINNYNPSLTFNSCDFKLLEIKYLEYIEIQKAMQEAAPIQDNSENSRPASITDQIKKAQAQLSNGQAKANEKGSNTHRDR